MSTMSYEELMKIVNYYVINRRGWKVVGWNVAPGEKSIVRYIDMDEHTHVACAIHLYAEMREDETFGVFRNVIENVAEIARRSYAELLVVFKRPNSRIVLIYIMDATKMNETFMTWTEGKQKQFQIPIIYFKREDEFEFDL